MDGIDEATGRARGGVARAQKLSEERRREISLKGVEAKRALAQLPKATHGSADRPLKIGDIEISCYVLADGTRLLAQRALLAGIGLSSGGGKGGERKIVNILATLAEKGIDIRGLIARANSPIRFLPPHGGNPADGYDATILPDLCAVLIHAGQVGALGKRLEHLAQRAAVLQHGFATLGIIALVDEATGFQKDRDRNNLARILEAFVAKEIQPYVRTFPPEYYEELFRLYQLPYPPEGNKSWRPQFFGKITNEVVYARLAPNLIPELKKVVSKAEKKARLHSALTQDIGHPKLREHLSSIVTIMKLSRSPKEFLHNVDRVHIRYGQTLPLLDGLEQSVTDGGADNAQVTAQKGGD